MCIVCDRTTEPTLVKTKEKQKTQKTEKNTDSIVDRDMRLYAIQNNRKIYDISKHKNTDNIEKKLYAMNYCSKAIQSILHIYQNGKDIKNLSFSCNSRECPYCAHKKQRKQIEKNLEKMQVVANYNLYQYLVVATVKHNKNDSMEIVYKKINKLKKQLIRAGKNYRNDKVQNTLGYLFSLGGVYNIEYTHNHKNGHNWHINFIVATDKPIDLDYCIDHNKKIYSNSQAIDNYKRITKDSYRLSISPIDNMQKSLTEAIGYTHKAIQNIREKKEMTSHKAHITIEKMQLTYNKKLQGSFGLFFASKEKIQKKLSVLYPNITITEDTDTDTDTDNNLVGYQYSAKIIYFYQKGDYILHTLDKYTDISRVDDITSDIQRYDIPTDTPNYRELQTAHHLD